MRWRPMSLVTCPTLYAENAKQQKILTDWPGVVALLLGAPRVRTNDKTSVPTWSPGERDASGVTVAVHLAAWDLDGIALVDALAICQRLESAGYAGLMHSTHRSANAGPGRVKARIVVPLAEAVPANRWGSVWAALRSTWAPTADPECTSPAHRYFLPSAPPQAPLETLFGVSWLGGPLPVPENALEGPPGHVPASRKVDVSELRLVAARWKRTAARAELHDTLRLALDGEPFGEVGDREGSTWRLCRALAEDIPDGSAESIAVLLAPSLALMGDGAPTAKNVVDKIERRRRAVVENAVQTMFAPKSAPRVLVSSVGSTYWIRGADDVWTGPVGGDAVDVSIVRALGPAVERGEIVLSVSTPQGPKPKTRAQILNDYGDRIALHEVALGRSAHEYDYAQRRFTEASAMPRELTSADAIDDFDLVRQFLAAMANDVPETYEDLHTWLSVLGDLTDTLACLVLLGEKDVGKTMFAYACARLWSGDGPTKASTFFGDWNDSILRCPLILADEKRPTDRYGRDLGAELREVLSSHSTTVRRRFMPTCEARGCVRMIMAANNEEILQFEGASTRADIAAIRERFYVVRLDEARMRAFFAAYPDARDRLVHHDGIARYARMLQQMPRAARRGRFWIRGSDHDLDKITIRAGAVGSLCAWVTSWLASSLPLTALFSKPETRVTPSGKILVSLGEMGASWTRYFPDEKPPARQTLAAACRAIGEQVRADGRGPRLWQLDEQAIQTWIDDAGWTSESVEELLAKRVRAQLPMLRLVP